MKKTVSPESISEIFALAKARETKAHEIGNLLVASLKKMKPAPCEDGCMLVVKVVESYNFPSYSTIDINCFVYKNGKPIESSTLEDDRHSLEVFIEDNGEVQISLKKHSESSPIPKTVNVEKFDFDFYNSQEACAKILCLMKSGSEIFSDCIDFNIARLAKPQKLASLKKQLDQP